MITVHRYQEPEEFDRLMKCKICNKENCENHSIEDQKEYEYLKLQGRNK